LAAYFSASGVTQKAAQMLAGAAKADLHEIRPEFQMMGWRRGLKVSTYKEYIKTAVDFIVADDWF